MTAATIGGILPIHQTGALAFINMTGATATG